jgi:hypothetical protein
MSSYNNNDGKIEREMDGNVMIAAISVKILGV